MFENQAFQRIPNVCRIARVAWQRSNPWHQLGAKELLAPTSYNSDMIFVLLERSIVFMRIRVVKAQ